MRRFAYAAYDDAVAFIETGRDRDAGRPIARNTRLVWAIHGGEQCIGVKLHDTVVAAWHPNDDVVLNTGGWFTSTTLQRIRDFTHADVGSTDGPVMLPSGHVVRRLRFGETPTVINGPWRQRQLERDAQREALMASLGRSLSFSHQRGGNAWTVGETAAVTSPKVGTCRRCSGTLTVKRGWETGRPCDCGDGRRDYGSLPVTRLFMDGVVVRVEAEKVTVPATEHSPEYSYTRHNTSFVRYSDEAPVEGRISHWRAA